MSAPRTGRRYRVTTVLRSDDDSIVSTILLEDDERNALTLRGEMRFQDLESVTEIDDVRLKTWVRLTSPVSIPVKNVKDAAAWFREWAKENSGPFPEPKMETVETSSGTTISGAPEEWEKAPTSEEWRKQIREEMDPVFLEEIETLYDGLSGSFQLAPLPALLAFVVHRSSCEASGNPTVTRAFPDCEFDEEFGFPCSDAQKQFVENLSKKKAPPPFY